MLTTELGMRLGGTWRRGQRGENLQLALLLTFVSQENIKEEVKESLRKSMKTHNEGNWK